MGRGAVDMAPVPNFIFLPIMSQRMRDEGGFGLIELLIAMLVLTVGVGALMMTFASSLVGLRHSGKEGTAVTIADRLLEQYRAMPFTSLPTSLTPNLASCPTPSTFPDPTQSCQTVPASQSPDHRSYIAQTWATQTTINPPAAPQYQQIAIIVAVSAGGTELARETTYFTNLDSSISTP